MYGVDLGEEYTAEQIAARRAAFDAAVAADQQAQHDMLMHTMDIIEGKIPNDGALSPVTYTLPDITVKSFPWWIPVVLVVGYLMLGKSRGGKDWL